MTNSSSTSLHNKGLDGLRGVLSLIVVISHSWIVYVNPMRFPGFGKGFETAAALGGRAAVLYFFALSGFVMAMSVQKNSLRNSGFRLQAFVFSRLVRIGPPLVAAFFLGWSLECWLKHLDLAVFPRTDLHLDRSSFVFNFREQFTSLLSLGLKGDLTGGVNGPLWSLRFELQCYVFCGLAAYIAYSDTALWKRLLALVALIYYAHRVHFKFNLDLICFSTFLFGWMCYWNQNRLTLGKIVHVMALFLVPWLVALAMTDLRNLIASEDMDTQLWMQVSQLGLGLSSALSLIALQKSAWLSRLKFIGDFSYTLYITHYLLLLAVSFLVFAHFPSISFPFAIFLFFGMTIVSMVVAALFALVVESPAAFRYKDNFITKIWHRFFSARSEKAAPSG